MSRTTSWVWTIAFTIMIAAAGCGDCRSYAEVEGVVQLGGKPLEGVEVVFMPDPLKGTKGSRASSYTDQEGRFKLRSEREERDGVVIGFHRVCVIDVAAVTTPSALPGMKGGADPTADSKVEPTPKTAPKAARVAPRYNNPASTPFSAEVKAGKQTITFDVQPDLK